MASPQQDGEDVARLVGAAEDVVFTLMKAFQALHRESSADSLWPLEALAQLVRDGNDYEKEEAAAALNVIAKDGTESQLLIAQAGAVPPLLHLARYGAVRNQRQWALRALDTLADANAAVQQAIASDGGIRTLVGGLTEGSGSERELTVWVLCALARGAAEHQLEMLDAGVVAVAVELLGSNHSHFQTTAVSLIHTLVYRSVGSPAARFLDSGVLESLLPLIQQQSDSDEYELKDRALRCLFSLSTGSDETKVAIINSGVIQTLVGIVRDGTDGQKLAAAQTLANLSSWRGDARERVIVDAEAITSLIKRLRGGDDDTKLRMAHVLGNLAYAAVENKNTLARMGVFGPLVHIIRVGNDTQKSLAMMAIGNLSHNHHANQNAVAAAGIIPLVLESLRTGNAQLKKRAADVLGDIVSNHPTNQINVAFSHGLTEALVALLREDDEKAQVPAARALGKLARGNTAIQMKIMRDGAVAELVRLLSSTASDVSKYAARALGALSVDLAANRIAVAQAGAVVPLVCLVSEGTDKQKKAAAKTLNNLMVTDALRAEVLHVGGRDMLLELTGGSTV